MMEWLTLVPPLSLALAGACGAVERPADGRARWWVIGALAGTAAAVSAALAWLLAVTDRPALHLPLSPWSNAVFTGDPALDVDARGAACMAAVGVLALMAVVRAPRADRSLGVALLVAAASTLFIAAARTPLGLVSSWLLLDAALFFGPRVGRRGLLASQLGLLCVLAALMGLPIDAATIDATAPSAWTRAWLAGAAAARMGLYPLWWTVPRASETTVRFMPATRLAPMAAGAYLLLAATPGELGAPFSAIVAALGMVAAWAGAGLAWSAGRGEAAVDWGLVHLGGVMLVAAALPGPFGPPVAMLMWVEAMVFGMVAYGGRDLPSAAAQWAGRLAAASAAGVMLGAGLAGRWLVVQTALARDMPQVAVLTALSAAPAVARWARGTGEPVRAGASSGAAGAAAVGAVALNVALGVAAVLAAGLSGTAGVPWPAAIPLHLSAPVAATLGLPVVLGLALSRVGDGAAARAFDPGGMARALRLTTLFDGLRTAAIRTGRFIHDRLGLIDSQRAMAWTLLAGLATGLAFLVPPATSAEAPPAGGWSSVIVADAVAAAMVLGPAPAVSLAALAAGYALVGVKLFVLGAGVAGPAVVLGVTKLVAGAVVVAILTLSATQTRGMRSAGAARRALAALRGHASVDHDRGLAGICLAIALLAALGIPSATLTEHLPLSALRVALGLIAGGVLTAVFARTALRVACGVLLALCGFDLVYAHIEPGLLITGALAVFHIAYAMVVTAFVEHDSAAGEAA